jgi:hypothetical protein
MTRFRLRSIVSYAASVPGPDKLEKGALSIASIELQRPKSDSGPTLKQLFLDLHSQVKSLSSAVSLQAPAPWQALT